MSTYLISWRPGPRAPVERHLTVTAPNMVQAAMVADGKIFHTYPNYMLCGVQLISPSLAPAIAEDALERMRAER